MATKKRKQLFAFVGSFDGAPCELDIFDAVRAGRDFSCRIRLTAPIAIDQELYGATRDQARELAFALCHCLLDRGTLRDARKKRVKLPGKPLPKPKKKKIKRSAPKRARRRRK